MNFVPMHQPVVAHLQLLFPRKSCPLRSQRQYRRPTDATRGCPRRTCWRHVYPASPTFRFERLHALTHGWPFRGRPTSYPGSCSAAPGCRVQPARDGVYTVQRAGQDEDGVQGQRWQDIWRSAEAKAISAAPHISRLIVRVTR